MAEIRKHNISKLDIGMLSALQMVLAERSVGKAARRFGLSQPAMSNALARMRIAFGDPLLVRMRNTMALTSRGQELLQQLEALLPQLERLAWPSRFEPSQARAQFNIATTDYAAMVLGPSIVSALRRDAPLCSLVMTMLQNREIDHETGEEQFDLRLGWLPAPPQSWYIRRLIDDEIVLIVSKDNENVTDEFTVEQFATVQQIGIRTGQPLYQSRIDQVLLSHGIKRNVAVWMSNFSAIPFLVAQSDLLAVVPKSLARLFCGHAGVRIVQPPFPLAGLNISMAWPARVHHDPAHRWLRSKVVESARSIGPIADAEDEAPDMMEPA